MIDHKTKMRVVADYACEWIRTNGKFRLPASAPLYRLTKRTVTIAMQAAKASPNKTAQQWARFICKARGENGTNTAAFLRTCLAEFRA